MGTFDSFSWLSSGPADGGESSVAANHLRRGDELLAAGSAEAARDAYTAAVNLRPDDPGYRCKLGGCLLGLDRNADAEAQAAAALAVAPEFAAAHQLLARICSATGRAAEAMQHSARAMALAPQDPDVAVTRAWILHEAGQTAAAWELLRPHIESGVQLAQLAYLFTRVARGVDREREAVAYALQVMESPRVGPAARAPIHLAVAGLLDSLGEYDRAFEQARLGKDAVRPAYEPRQLTQWVDVQVAYFTPAKLHDLPRASIRTRRPVFVVGMPRSGTTLVEQILASHAMVYGAGELPAIANLATYAQGRLGGAAAGVGAYPASLDSAGIRHANDMAQSYLADLSKLDATADRVVDKMPHNFLYVGLITMLFPDAYVIHCRRDPLDTCLSCYMTFFAKGQSYAHDLSDLGAFYLDYRRMMRHWTGTLNIPTIDVHYEDLVTDTAAQTRRLLELLDLPWDANCLRFHETRRRVITASVDQVRRPIYASSVNRSRHYARHLSALRRVLAEGHVGESFAAGRVA